MARQRRSSRATLFLMASWIIASLLVWNMPNREEYVPILAYSTENVVKGYLWTPVTSIFIHADLLHLLMNALAFYFFGKALEGAIGPKRMLIVFFLGAFMGDVISSVFYPFDALSVGASGGVSAVLGAAIFIAPFRFSAFPYLFPAPIVIIGMIYVVSNIVGLVTDTVSTISYAAHVGGLVFGLTYGLSKVGPRRGITILMAGILILAVAAYLLNLILG